MLSMRVTDVFENWSVRNKIATAFVVILVLVGGLGYAAVGQLAAVTRTVDSLTGDSLVVINDLSEMRQALLRYRLAVARYIIAKNLSPEFDASVDRALAKYHEWDAHYAPTVQSPAERVNDFETAAVSI
jgi:hypothetical protein